MNPTPYLDLDRRFVDHHERDISTLTMRMLGESADRLTVGWDELLRSRCVVVLGEPGCGKTTETKANVDSLRAAGGHAFYRPVSDLCRAGSPLVTQPERARLDAWRVSGADCVFALDSLDEARNAGGALHAAIDRLASELTAEWHRVRVVLTCRVAEWRPEEDIATLGPFFQSEEPALRAEPEHAASPAAPYSHARRRRTAPQAESAPTVRVVRMAVLSEEQALTLAVFLGAKNAERLRDEVRRSAAWALLERPADVTWLVRSWNRRGSVGTLTQLMEDNVAARLEETSPTRRRVSALSAQRAVRAAGEIALCATLTGEHRVRVAAVSPGVTTDALDPSSALPWMSSRELTEFTERAIFLDEGPGIRRVHHRAVEEYLAAGALSDAIGKNPGGLALAKFLVRDVYGRRVVPPSLRGIAGWACGDADVRRALVEVDPFVLLEAGDPESVPPGERRGVLRRILEELESLPGRREGADHASIARFACPELGEIIRERLASPSEPGTELILRLVWHGRLVGNAEDALRAAMRPDLAPDLRVLAIRAAAAAGDDSVRQRLLALVLRGRKPTTEFLFEVANELYPTCVSPWELGAGLVAWATTESSRSRSELSHWSWFLDQVYEPSRHEELVAVVGPAVLSAARAIPARRHGAGAAAVRLSVILRTLMERSLREGVRPDSTLAAWAPWLWALARIHEAGGADGHLHRGAQELLDRSEVRRSVVRWLVRNRLPAECTEPARPFAAFRDEPHDLWRPRPGDVHWLLEDLRTASTERERLVWFGLAYQAATVDDLDAVEAAAMDYPALGEEVARIRARRNAPPDPRQMEFERRERDLAAERTAREKENRQALQSLLQEIRRGDHDGALRFLTERIEEDNRGRWGHSDWESLSGPFGREVAEAARDGLMVAWRRHRPMLPHERPRPNEVEWFVPVGLTGLNIAFASGLDPDDLPEDAVERATAYALCEINDFPQWFGTLAVARPAGVLPVLELVLRTEYSGHGATTERYVLDNLGHRDPRVRRLVTPALIGILETEAPIDAEALSKALAALDPDEEERPRLLRLARARASLSLDPVGSAWWLCLAGLDARAAASILRAAASERTPPDALLAAVAAVDWRAAELPAEELAEVVRSTYRVVHPAGDRRRTSGESYSPGVRDQAERTRSGLVSHLAGIPGEATFRALLGLADDPLLLDHRDWFALLAHERAQRDAERPPLSIAQARAFISAQEEVLASENAFFEYAVDRLQDLKATLEQGDFSCRELLRVADEAGVQRFVAHSLRLATFRRCSVVREEEVDRLKKPDIRLHTSGPAGVVGIEIKVADSWPASQLEAALERQLVGQYLRDARSRHGVLLLVHNGSKRRWGRGLSALTFEGLAERLSQRALQISGAGAVQVRVVPIDCSTVETGAGEPGPRRASPARPLSR